MANNNQELNNLKTIHKIQVSGEIQNILKALRSSKSVADNLFKNISNLKKENESKVEKTTKPEVVTEKVSVVLSQEKPKVEVIASVKNEKNNDVESNLKQDNREKREFSSQDRKENNQRPYNNQQPRQFNNQQPRPFNNGDRQFNNNRPFNNDRAGNTNRPYNNDRPFNNNRPFNNDGQTNGQRQFDGRKPFDNTQKPFQRQNPNYQKRTFDPNKPAFDRNSPRPNFDRNSPRPQTGGKQFGVGFVQSKGNNMKVFDNTLESSKVLAIPERSFGNKNKSQRNIEEKNKIALKKGGAKKNFVILTDGDYEEVTMGSRKFGRIKKEKQVFIAPAVEHAIITGENVTVKVLSERIGKPVAEIIKKLMILGIMATINSSIDFTTAELVANELGITLEQKIVQTAEQELTAFVEDEDDDENMMDRAPVVAVMGHVDHGKTSLLDMIRKTNVVSGEAGGITQRIGAYQVVSNGSKITFLDTPGHAAFTSMRARGAKITDVAILVVAADDGIMPQTIEAINHIKAAEIPMVVAINKMDKKEANPDRIKQQLSEHGVLPEEWGGDTVLVPVSAKTGVGIDNLLNMILLVSQMQDLKANPKKLAVATVVEAALDKARGPVATVLVQNGTLKVGDTVISGITYGKVKAMFDENGNTINEAGPSTPVSMLGFNEVPQSGDQVFAVDEKLSKQVIQERKNKIKSDKAGSTSAVGLDDFMDKVNEGKLKNLNIIVKADVQGSVEALKQSLIAVSNDEVRVVCVHSGAGPVTESDLVLAQASDSIVINFNLKLENKIKQMAESMGVVVKEYKVIYEVVEEIGDVAKGMREKVYEKIVVGHAEVRVVFKLSSQGTIAGSYVTDGKIMRNQGARVLRGGEEIADTTVEALKIQKDDKAEVNYNYECGIKLRDFTAFKEGDIIEAYQKVEVKN